MKTRKAVCGGIGLAALVGAAWWSRVQIGWFAGMVGGFAWTCGAIASELAAAVLLVPTRGTTDGRFRASSDATWFVPVYVWALESLVAAGNYGVEQNPISWCAVPSGVMLVATLASCLGAERWAKRSGARSRLESGSVPVPVVAAMAAVQLVWLAVLVARTMHVPV